LQREFLPYCLHTAIAYSLVLFVGTIMSTVFSRYRLFRSMHVENQDDWWDHRWTPIGANTAKILLRNPFEKFGVLCASDYFLITHKTHNIQKSKFLDIRMDDSQASIKEITSILVNAQQEIEKHKDIFSSFPLPPRTMSKPNDASLNIAKCKCYVVKPSDAIAIFAYVCGPRPRLHLSLPYTLECLHSAVDFLNDRLKVHKINTSKPTARIPPVARPPPTPPPEDNPLLDSSTFSVLPDQNAAWQQLAHAILTSVLAMIPLQQ
jgi:hypothetical protein